MLVGEQFVQALVVDDFEPWRRLVCLMLQQQMDIRIVGEASDGQEAVQKAEDLQPDLILLDVGLPTLNGIEAARRIRRQSPKAKILFFSENLSPDIAQAALATGAAGYAVKSDGAGELLRAVTAVLRGTRFLSRRFAEHDFVETSTSLFAHPAAR
jgi:DNA-binding NarL/FixJ family response regulator